MARLLRTARVGAIAESRLGRYLGYAAGEVFQIFIGITLALWFSNLNEQRRLRIVEEATLGEIAANLRANADIIRGNIDRDRSSLADCDAIIELIDSRIPWTGAHSLAMDNCRTWTSPYLRDAAYESLRSRGTDLISEREVRNSIINLHEYVYEYLVNDTDWSQRAFEESVWGPVFARHIEHRGPQNSRPSDYAEFVESTEFRNALARHIRLLEVSIRRQEAALNDTLETLHLIETGSS
jgi:hypothetical protein